jgi:hypothetical protein
MFMEVRLDRLSHLQILHTPWDKRENDSGTE